MANYDSWADLKAALVRGEIRLPTNEELLADLHRANLTIFDESSSFSRGMFTYIRRYEEGRIRECLGRWVSELPPTLIYQGGRFVGLGLEGDISVYPKIYVKPADDRYIEWWSSRGPDHRSIALAYSFEAKPDPSA